MAPRDESDEPPDRDGSTPLTESGDPYESVDTEALPAWWAEAVAEFREHDLRPYKPPRFEDDVVVPPVVDRLESQYGVDIKLMGVDVQYGDAWGVYVDGTRIATVERERTSEAYTRYGVTSDAFEEIVREAVGEGTAENS